MTLPHVLIAWFRVVALEQAERSNRNAAITADVQELGYGG
jgi:hypothetical protein